MLFLSLAHPFSTHSHSLLCIHVHIITSPLDLLAGIASLLLPVETANRQLEDTIPAKIKHFGFDRRSALLSEETIEDFGSPVEEVDLEEETTTTTSTGSTGPLYLRSPRRSISKTAASSAKSAVSSSASTPATSFVRDRRP